MKVKTIFTLCLLVLAGLLVPGRAQMVKTQSFISSSSSPALPDLVITEVKAVPNNDRHLRVNISNIGGADAGACNLKLFYHRSGKVMVKGTFVPPTPANQNQWVLVKIGSPIAAASSVTLRVDDPNRVTESDEGNNSHVYK